MLSILNEFLNGLFLFLAVVVGYFDGNIEWIDEMREELRFRNEFVMCICVVPDTDRSVMYEYIESLNAEEHIFFAVCIRARCCAVFGVNELMASTAFEMARG